MARPDLRRAPGGDEASVAYGMLPPNLFGTIRDRFIALVRRRRSAGVTRSGWRKKEEHRSWLFLSDGGAQSAVAARYGTAASCPAAAEARAVRGGSGLCDWRSGVGAAGNAAPVSG
jgi:hypothetical protein